LAVAFARPLGLSDEQIAATVLGASEDPAWSQADAQLIAAADALYETNGIPDELWAKLSTRFGEDRLLELVIVAGWYRLISYVINAARVELEPWAERFPNVGAAG
jgi:4-carboxymuconolactone decarboxylase